MPPAPSPSEIVAQGRRQPQAAGHDEERGRPVDSLLPSDEPVGFQVWHKQGERHEYVASVESNALGAMLMTTHGFMGYPRWPDNPDVMAAPGEHRSTTVGDVLIGRDGLSMEISADKHLGLYLKPIASVDGIPRPQGEATAQTPGSQHPVSPSEIVAQEKRPHVQEHGNGHEHRHGKGHRK